MMIMMMMTTTLDDDGRQAAQRALALPPLTMLLRHKTVRSLLGDDVRFRFRFFVVNASVLLLLSSFCGACFICSTVGYRCNSIETKTIANLACFG